MFELLNEPGYTDAGVWQTDFQSLLASVRTGAPDNVCIIPGLGTNQTWLPPNKSDFIDPTEFTNTAYGIHGYFADNNWASELWSDLYGYVAKFFPMVMTEVYGKCDNAEWPALEANFTSMLEYNYSTNIGVTSWVFDDLADEHDAVISQLGTPNKYTDPWTWAVTNCKPGVPDWAGINRIGPVVQYSSWMLSH